LREERSSSTSVNGARKGRVTRVAREQAAERMRSDRQERQVSDGETLGQAAQPERDYRGERAREDRPERGIRREISHVLAPLGIDVGRAGIEEDRHALASTRSPGPLTACTRARHA
jgi:hypothetical protein